MPPETLSTALGAGPGLAALYAVLLWWSSTGLVLYLDGLPRSTFRASLLVAAVLASLAVAGLVWSSGQPTVAGAYTAFTCALLVWGWNEMAFLMGFVTGPRKTACPDGCSGWRHFGHATSTLLYHELCLLASAAAILALTWGGPNQVGGTTFLILWAMRLSTKLNVFLGVPNLSEELLPEHLGYLRRYFTRRPMNLLFPFSVSLATLLAGWFVVAARGPGAEPFAAVGASLLAALSALAVFEHWALVLPIPATRLFGWGLRSRSSPSPTAGRDRPEASELIAPSGEA